MLELVRIELPNGKKVVLIYFDENDFLSFLSIVYLI